MSDAARERLRGWGADTAIVLGSGLNSLADGSKVLDRIAYSEFSELPPSTVPGHSGEFILATFNGRPVICAKGRVHLYEGHSARTVTTGILLLASVAIKRVILTNAAGTANPDFAPGSWMMIRDHLNLTGTSPLVGAPQFIDMGDCYSAAWRRRFSDAASAIGVTLNEGVYAGLLGPQYETPAEVTMLRRLGADAIGMSTVLEAIQARALGLEVAGFSCLTNWAAGIGQETLSHGDVLTTGRAAAEDFERLLTQALATAS